MCWCHHARLTNMEGQGADGPREGGMPDVPVPQKCNAQIAHLQCEIQMQELDKLAWFRSMKGVASLVADAMKEDSAHALSDVSVALQAAHLLVWQHETEHGEACLYTLHDGMSSDACRWLL